MEPSRVIFSSFMRPNQIFGVGMEVDVFNLEIHGYKKPS